MKYMLLIYGNPNRQLSDAEIQAEMGAYFALNQVIKAKGAWVSGDALHPVQAATTVRVRDGKSLVTDGPFAESKEVLGGYYVIDVENLDAAIEIAHQIPGTSDGSTSIEVRPLVVFG
jgi:hypothetical protein